MLRITKQTDYGFLLLVTMASSVGSSCDGATFNARDLAEETQLPGPMVSKILKLLAREGILVSRRGTKGGYELARGPREISAAQVISALEGPIAVTECSGGDDCQCSVERSCPVRVTWRRINDAIQGALADVTLWEMIHPLTRQRLERTEISQGARDMAVG